MDGARRNHTHPAVGASSLAVILGINTYLKFIGGGGGEYLKVVIRDACLVIMPYPVIIVRACDWN